MSKRPKKPLKNRIFKILGLLIPAFLLYWIFAVKIPSEVSYQEIWTTITSLTLTENLILVLGGLLTIVTYGWTSAAVLPGLPLKQGTQSAVSGQLTSVILPAPVDLAIRFSMYKSYGFSIDKSTVAVTVAGIARYFIVFIMPVIGLGLMLVTGQGTSGYLTWFVLGSLLILFALWFMKITLSSEKTAKKIGEILDKIVNKFLKLLKRKNRIDLVSVSVGFGKSTRGVAVDHFRSILLSNLVWGFSSFLVLFFAIRFVGIDSSVFSVSYIFLITGMMLLFNAFPITPGGIGVTEALLITLISFPSSEVQTAFMSAMFLYRIYTWLLPMPVGAVAYASWKKNNKTEIPNLSFKKDLKA
jgi:uncharacterized membrane protein YbhN (UPF0104 family)